MENQINSQTSSASSTLTDISTPTTAKPGIQSSPIANETSTKKVSNAKFDKKTQAAQSKPKSNFSSSNNGQRFNLNKNRVANNGNHDTSCLDNRPYQKKTNLNHLLNFTYESRDPHENYYEYERSSKQFWSAKLSKCSVFSKEQFLQANCQFVVKNNSDYSVHMCDPDRLVDWDKIEEIQIETLEALSCPICLYEPVCGKMTKCGHIYCWSCILHYLSLSDKPWRKCPICYDSIYKNDLKSVKVLKHANEFKIGDEISMNLMFRFKTKYNTIILPASCLEQFISDEKNNKLISFSLFNGDNYAACKQYFKIHSKTPDKIFEEVIKREREDLVRQIETDKHQPEVCFVNEAIALLDEREIGLQVEIGNKSPKRQEFVKKVEPVEVRTVITTSLSYTDAFDNVYEEKINTVTNSQDQTEIRVSETLVEETLINVNTVQENSESPPQKPYEPLNTNELTYFYQSTDGQRIYINGLNNRCLISEYSSLGKCPLSINGRIITADSFFMTEENRKRYKYLSHLPLHSEFKLAELDLKEPLISQKTLEQFHGEIEDRKRTRERKHIREKREADRIAALKDSAPHYYVQSAMNDDKAEFIKSSIIEPVIDYANEFPEASSSPPVSSGASLGEISTASSIGGVGAEQHKSFAQMLKVVSHVDLGKESPLSASLAGNSKIAWPTLDSNSSASAGSSQLTSGWVTMAKQQQSMLGRAKRYQNPPSPWGVKSPLSGELNEDDDGDHMPAPLYKQSFFSAIDESLKSIESKKSGVESSFVDGMAVLAVDTQSSAIEAEQNAVSKQQTKKKKKNKQLLFSTSLNMGF